MKSKSIFAKRQQAFQKVLENLKIDFFVCDHPTDIFYLTGIHVSAGRLLIHQKTCILFVDGRYIEDAKKTAHSEVRLYTEKNFLEYLQTGPWKQAKHYGFDTSMPYENVLKLKRFLSSKKMRGLDRPLLKLRTIKDQTEIVLIKKSAALLWEGYIYLKSKLKEGVEERELALDFEIYCRKKGAESLSFSPIIAFGSNSALPHYHSGKRQLKSGDIVLMDLGVMVEGYASDMTRVHFFGEENAKLKQLYQVVEASKEEALEMCKPGVFLTEVDAAARGVMKKAKLEKHFLHSLGHGIGLNVHELPSFRDKKAVLEPGMVLTIEPGLYISGIGGVRLEDMVIITENGHENLFMSKAS